MAYYSNYNYQNQMAQNGYVPGCNPPVSYAAMPDTLSQLRQNQGWAQQPMPMQPQTPPQAPQAAQEQPMIWVQGDAGAKAYMVANGSTVVLWDSERDVIYVKSADMSGMPSMRVFAYNEITSNGGQNASMNHQASHSEQFVTRREFDALAAEMAGIRQMITPIQPMTRQEDTNNVE